MRPKRSLLLPLTMLCLSVCTYAQSWSGILDRTRAIDWTQAGAGTIPNRTAICANLTPSATTSTINNAIAACPANQVVSFSAGTYTISAGIKVNGHNNVTLRGAGPTQTILRFIGDDTCGGLGGDLCVINSSPDYSGGPGNTANWSAGYSAGTTSITLSGTANLKVGSQLILDQLKDGGSDTYPSVWMPSVPGSTCIGCNIPGRPGRPQQQIVTVTGINGNTVTISPGLYMPNWRAAQSPGAWWSSALPVTGVGIENMTLDHSASVGFGAVYFYNATKCWMSNVRSLNAHDHHVALYQSNHLTVRDSYFYGTQAGLEQSYGPGGYEASDILVENNIGQNVASFMMSETNQGSVFGYNFSTIDYFGFPSNLDWAQASSYQHAPGNNYLLWEGNVGFGLTEDNYHGPAHFITAFRNRWTGWESGKLEQTVPVDIYSFNRYTNLLGNVLGLSGFATNYQAQVGDGSGISVCYHSIYATGWGGNCNPGGNGWPADDARVSTTLMRWGNYDTVTGGNRFVSGEVPSGLSLYANAVPSSNSLPSSFYLHGKPSWFGSVPFPAIGPDVSGGNMAGVGGRANKIPAQQCFERSTLDSDYSNAYSINSGSRSGNTVTLAIGAAAASVRSETLITVTGATPSGYNCPLPGCPVVGTTASTVSYVVPNDPGPYSSGGSLNWPVVLNFDANACYGDAPPPPDPPSNLSGVVQ